MSNTVQISLDEFREDQLVKIQELDPTIPKGTSKAIKHLLFNRMNELSGVYPSKEGE
jgi:hypothetical protein